MNFKAPPNYINDKQSCPGFNETKPTGRQASPLFSALECKRSNCLEWAGQPLQCGDGWGMGIRSRRFCFWMARSKHPNDGDKDKDKDVWGYRSGRFGFWTVR